MLHAMIMNAAMYGTVVCVLPRTRNAHTRLLPFFLRANFVGRYQRHRVTSHEQIRDVSLVALDNLFVRLLVHLPNRRDFFNFSQQHVQVLIVRVQFSSQFSIVS